MTWLISVILLRGSNTKPPLTAEALFRITEEGKSQLDAWLEQSESHEYLAVGRQISPAVSDIENFLKDVNENVLR